MTIDPKTLLAVALLFLPIPGCAPRAPMPGTVGVAQVPKDAPAADASPVHAERIAVAFGDVKELASLLDRTLVESRNRGAVRAVTVDGHSGELIVFATPEGIARVRAFLAPGVLEEPGADNVEVLNLAHAEAQNVLSVVSPLIGGRVRIVADPATNALVVSGDADSRERVKRMVTALDVARASAARAP